MHLNKQALFNIKGSVPTLADLQTIDPPVPGDVYIVESDSSHDNASTMYKLLTDDTWEYMGKFQINLQNYYTKRETYDQPTIDGMISNTFQQSTQYTDNKASQEAANRQSAITNLDNLLSQDIINTVATSENQTKSELYQALATSLSGYVPTSRTINGKALYVNITLDSTDIQFVPGTSVYQALSTVKGALIFKGLVPTYNNLPNIANIPNGQVYTVQDIMTMYVSSDGEWVSMGSFAIDLGPYYKKDETYSKSQVDNSINSVLSTLSASIVSAANATFQSAKNYTDDRLDNDITPSLKQYADNAVSNLQNYVDTNKVDKTFPVSLVYDAITTPEESAVTMTLYRHYLNGTQNNKTLNLPMVSNDAAGFMPNSDHKAIADLQTRMQSLEELGVFVGVSYDSYADLMSAAIDSKWTVNDYTFVLDDESHEDHQTIYILVQSTGGSLNWAFSRYDDQDIPLFNATTAGIITPSATDGNISGNADNTGSVNGWSTLKSRVSDTESDINTIKNTTIPAMNINALPHPANNPDYYTLLKSSNVIADHLVTMEYVDEQDESVLADAKEYTDNKATATLATAASDATTKANNAQAAAAADATTKANNAQANAISTAATNATAKANAAQANAIQACLPVGYVYTQYPGELSPAQLNLYGTWTQLTGFDGAFFRGEGGDALSFQTSRGSPQAEGLPNITGYVTGPTSWPSNPQSSGALYWSDRVALGMTADNNKNEWYGWININAAMSSPIYSASSHVTPVNYTIRLWKRTA
ncbi:hypothetical protein FACS1894172_09250 [Spirochaetia bacterium]|nr:hypothetical protein FACS1894164_11670 [Spirochaetia bacterium]GHU32509.1 hypothetical protein FACS1894172_09250 [Spirochaetia bacterium]